MKNVNVITIKKIKRIAKKAINEVENIFVHIIFVIYKPFVNNHPKVATFKKTMTEIKKGKSLARFGDGELEAINYNIPKSSFQENSLELANSIKNSFEKEDTNLLIAISSCFSWDLSSLNKVDRQIWEKILIMNWSRWEKIINKRNFYYNAYVTRPYFQFSKSISRKIIKKVFEDFRSIWKNKSVLLVEGKYTRFGVNDDLLDGCDKVARIICPPRNAFKKIKEIENAIRNYVKKNKPEIILISLGPAATILTCNLIDIGIQVLDIGHLDLEYNWFLIKAIKKKTIVGKYNNEGLPHFIEFKNDEILKKYNQQIVEVIN